MRYGEILEAAREIRQLAGEQDKRKRAREQIAAADRKRGNAARRYQDDLEATRTAAAQAKAKLSSLGVSEANSVPGASEELLERPKSYALRDRGGVILGWIAPVGQVLQAKDRFGTVVGWYDGRTNQTRNEVGSIVGDGDLLAALIIMQRP